MGVRKAVRKGPFLGGPAIFGRNMTNLKRHVLPKPAHFKDSLKLF